MPGQGPPFPDAPMPGQGPPMPAGVMPGQGPPFPDAPMPGQAPPMPAGVMPGQMPGGVEPGGDDLMAQTLGMMDVAPPQLGVAADSIASSGGDDLLAQTRDLQNSASQQPGGVAGPVEAVVPNFAQSNLLPQVPAFSEGVVEPAIPSQGGIDAAMHQLGVGQDVMTLAPQIPHYPAPATAPGMPTADDLIDQNMHWMDDSMRQLVEAMREQAALNTSET